MAQTRNHEFLANDDTLSINLKAYAFAPEGRYSGFYLDVGNTSGSQLSLTHTGNPSGDFKYPIPEQDGTIPTTFSADIGSWMSKGAVLVRENSSITLNGWNPNTSGDDRIDLVIGIHFYSIATEGGVTATYTFLEGTPSATPVRPALTDELTQVVLGEIYVPAGATGLEQCTYTPEPTPEFARNNIRQEFDNVLDEIDALEAQVQQLSDDFDQLVLDFNTFTITITNQQNNFETTITNQQNQFETDITNQQNQFETTITNQQNQFEATTQQFILDNLVEMRYDPDPLSPNFQQIQWKYTGEDNTQWRNLGIGVIFPAGTVFDLETQYTLLSPVENNTIVPVDSFLYVPFSTIVSDLASAFLQNRFYKAPTVGNAEFVVDSFRLELPTANPTNYNNNSSECKISVMKEEPNQTAVEIASETVSFSGFGVFPSFQDFATIDTQTLPLNQEDLVYVKIETYATSFDITKAPSVNLWGNMRVVAGNFYIKPI